MLLRSIFVSLDSRLIADWTTFRQDLKKWIQIGGSRLRGTLALGPLLTVAMPGCKVRDHVTPDDVRAIAPDCLRHRLIFDLRGRRGRNLAGSCGC